MFPGITYTFDEVRSTYGPPRLLTVGCPENMANVTGNYHCSENGNDTGWEHNAWKLWGWSLGPVLAGSKALAQRSPLCPAEHKVILSILPQAANRSDGKRHSFTLTNPYSAMIWQTNHLLLPFQQFRIGSLKTCFDTQSSNNQWQNQRPSHCSAEHFWFI